jgi:asparagine synthase (glutamine-hydrolysing)
MCGISGIINIQNKDLVKNQLDEMNSSMKHRGPDDEGVFYDDFVGLTQTRLSIIDLSSQGHQPMLSKDNQLAIVFNGEIYNFKSLKKELSDYDFVTQTDTEVILAAYLKWGIDMVEKLDGMFAIALYDIPEKKVYLIRDRLGVKPLYYYQSEHNETFFASEIRTIIKGAKIKPKLNQNELKDYLTFQTCTSNQTLVKGIYTISPGTYHCYSNQNNHIVSYWKPTPTISSTDSRVQAVKNVRELLFQSVEKRLMADVPLGAFLSGGVDSSAIVAAMSEFGSHVNTFNVNFAEDQFSEAVFAQIIAKKFNTNHTEINLKPNEFLNLLPNGIEALDHPSVDGLNTYVVSKATKDAGITVALSGVGGDEWFAGYPIFNRLVTKQHEKLKLIPKPLRSITSTLAQLKTNETTRKRWEFFASDLSFNELYQTQKMVFSTSQINHLLNYNSSTNSNFDIANISELSVLEWQKYLMPVLLRDTDQMGMAHSLEIREPFMDYQLIEYLLSLPDAYKLGNQPKQLLVDAMGGLLPNEIVNRPKMGFVLPYEVWLKTDLKDYVKQGLSYIKSHQAFNTEYVAYLETNYFENHFHIRWNMIWILAVLGHWMNNNQVS